MALFPSIALANLITNGGFDTGNFSGWVQSGNTGSTNVSGAAAHGGFFGGQFGSVGSLGFISQTFATTPGATYTLDYWLRNADISGAGLIIPSEFKVSWNGTQLTDLSNGAGFAYTEFTFSGLLATASTTTLTFGFRHDPSFWFIDDVSVAPTAIATVPDGGVTAGLMVIALGGLAFVRRRLR